MKATLLKSLLSIVPLGFCLTAPTIAKGKGLDHPAASPHGHLTVYLTSDEYGDRSAWYFPHSFYAIYTIDGKLFRNVINQPPADEDIPDVMALPVGTYTVVGRSEKGGYIRLPVVIKAGERTTVDLNLRERAR
jgi:hypothetical protein